MQIEVMEHFGINKYFRDADFFETEAVKRIFKQLKKIIPEGQLIALTGVVGIGKTTYLERIQKQLAQKKGHSGQVAFGGKEQNQPDYIDHRFIL